MSSFIAAGTAYANHDVHDPLLHLLLDVRLPAHRRPGLGGRATCAARGFLLGGTAGRTTLAGEGLQHQDGHSHLQACRSPT
jgi:pyruvate dehydrogenase E1 component